MTTRLSTGTRNAKAGRLGFGLAFNRGRIEVYTGSQPITGDAAVTGTLLGIFTASSGALTKETRATGSITLASGASGSVLTASVGGLNMIPDAAVPFNASLTQTASDLCDAINRNGIMEASVSGAVVTIKGHPGTGATTAAITTTLTTLTTTQVNMGSGIAGIAPVNGLLFGAEGLGIIAKSALQVWGLTGLVTGIAGWARLYSSDIADTGALLTAAPWYPRLDGTCGVGSGDFQLSTLSITAGLPVTMDTFTWTQPAQ